VAARTLLKAWSTGGITAADVMMLDMTMDLFVTEDATESVVKTVEALNAADRAYILGQIVTRLA
jgi:hypothetical protein